MATLTAIAYNPLETVCLVQSQVAVSDYRVIERDPEAMPLRMRWVCETDSRGRNILRVRWVQDDVATE
jgi:hypothetical protein